MQILDFSQLQYRRPIEKGYVVNWDLQSRIWDRLFTKCLPNVSQHPLVGSARD